MGLMILSLASCSTDTDSTPEYAVKDDRAGKKDGVSVMFKSTYAHNRVTIYDVENKQYIDDIKGAEFFHNYELEHGKHYIFHFERDNAETIDNQEPFVGIYINNVSTGKVIEDFEREGCTIGYNFNFIVL